MIDTVAILAQTDLVALIREHIKLTKRGKDWYGSCPFHTGDRTPSFSVVPAKRFFHCHGCGAYGTAIDFVMRIENLSFLNACARLGGASASPEVKRRLYEERRERARQTREAIRQQNIVNAFLDRNPSTAAIDVHICAACQYPVSCDCWQ